MTSEYGDVCVSNFFDKTGRHSRDAIVCLDGVPQNDVISFNEEEGYIVQYRRVDGKFVVDNYEQGLLAVDRKTGKVSLSFKP